MEKFIVANNIGKGFITHEDQELDGLKFKDFGSDIIKVKGEEDKITAWINRVSGSEISEVEATVVIKAKEKADKMKRITELKSELTILQNEIK